MKEYDELTPSESERYEELIRAAYPQPSPHMKEKVMARIAAERERRRRRSQFIMKLGSLAACLVILSVVAIKALPLLSGNKKLAADANNMEYFYEGSAPNACYDLDVGDTAEDRLFRDLPFEEELPESNGADDAEAVYGSEDDPYDGKYSICGNAVTADEAVNAYNIACEALVSNTAAVGGDDMFAREYRDEVYNIAYLTNVQSEEEAPVSRDELQSWEDETFLAKTAEEQKETPTLYQAIHELGISKETLVALNDVRKERNSEMALPDEVIDALYLEEDDMKLALTNSLALNYNGKIYTFNDVRTMFDELASDGGIPPEVMVEYVEKVVDYCVENGIMTEDTVERWIENIGDISSDGN